MALAEKAKKVLDILEKEYPNARIALNFKTHLDLLVATILSAQCTDDRVNKTTPALFKRYKKVRDYAEADIKEVEGFISSINFFRNKAKSIQACCRKIIDTHVKRVSNRIGLAASDNPDKIEEELCRIIPQKRWAKATNLLILHGRNICTAKNPRYDICKVRDYCDYYTAIK